jgi:hypothetical protein
MKYLAVIRSFKKVPTYYETSDLSNTVNKFRYS